MNYKIKGLEVEITDEQLDELIKERENKGKPWKPGLRDEYWVIDSWGDLNLVMWTNAHSDNYCYDSGNCFKTEEKAKAKLDYLKAVNTVNAKIRELNDGWTPDWDDWNQRKYEVYCRSNGDWGLDFWMSVSRFSIFEEMKSREVAQQVIKECAEELDIIKKYKFNN